MLSAAVLFHATGLMADSVRVRYVEGVTLGLLVLQNLNGQPLAYGELDQVVNASDGVVTADLRFHFKDGSSFRETTKFTQHGEFRLVSDHLSQKGPSFKKESETWIEAATGTVRVRTVENGKDKETTKHLDLPPDVANGLLFTLIKNLDPNANETTVSMVAASGQPRLVSLHITPAPGKTIRVGWMKREAQQYVVKVKIGGVAGVVAPLVGKQPPDIHVWVSKGEAPGILESEGPLTEDTPVWRIRLSSPQYGSPRAR